MSCLSAQSPGSKRWSTHGSVRKAPIYRITNVLSKRPKSPKGLGAPEKPIHGHLVVTEDEAVAQHPGDNGGRGRIRDYF